MGTTAKMIASALVGSALTVAAMTILDGDPRRPEDPPAASPRPPTAEEPAPSAVLRGSPVVPPAIESLAPSDAEVEWMRRALEEERRRSEAARIRAEDSGLDVLRRAVDERADVGALLRDFDAFQARVRTGSGRAVAIPSRGDRTTVSLDQVAGGAEVIEFGPGTFDLRRGGEWHRPRGEVESLEVRGAGMDRTTLVTSGDFLTVLGRMKNLRIRDLTFEGDDRGDQVLDVRGRCAAVLERVRVRGWSSGGHGAPIGVSGEGYLGCRDCEFLGAGEGGGHTAVSVRGSSLVALERCLLADVPYCVMGWGGAAAKSAMAISDCTFENTGLTHGGFLHLERPEFPLWVRGGSVAYGDPGRSEAEARADWGEPFAAEVTGVAFSRRIPRCTVADLVDALDGAAVPGGPRLVGVEAIEVSRTGPGAVLLHAATEDGRSTRAYRATKEADRWVVEENRRGGGTAMRPPHESEDALGLVEAVRRSGIPRSAEATHVWYMVRPQGEGKSPLPTVHVGTRSSSGRAFEIDATTGRLLPAR